MKALQKERRDYNTRAVQSLATEEQSKLHEQERGSNKQQSSPYLSPRCVLGQGIPAGWRESGAFVGVKTPALRLGCEDGGEGKGVIRGVLSVLLREWGKFLSPPLAEPL